MNNNFSKIIEQKLGAFPIGVWVPYYKKDLNIKYLEQLKESGVNFIPSLDCSKEELSLIAASGLKVIANDDRITYCNVTGMPNIAKWSAEYRDNDEVIGIFIWDEPSPEMMDICGAINKAVQKSNENLFGYINLHPNYSDKETQRNGLSYEDYIQYFVNNCSPKVISFDHYPFYEDGFHETSFYDNLHKIREACNKNNLDFWSFIQSASFMKNTEPNEAQLNYQVHVNLAYGAKGILYFTYAEVTHEKKFGRAFLDKDGNKTPIYGYAQKINREIEKIGDTLLSLTHEGVFFTDKSFSEFSTVRPSFNVDGGNFVLGLFKQGENRFCYIVNSNLNSAVEALVGDIKIKLNAGEGKLIAL